MSFWDQSLGDGDRHRVSEATKFSRRAALGVALGSLVAPLVGCALGDDPDLVALRRDYMATWMPENVLHEYRQETNPTSGFVGATDYASILRVFTAPDEERAAESKATAVSTALANGWRLREDQQGRITKILSTDSEAELIIGDRFPKPEWSITLSA